MNPRHLRNYVWRPSRPHTSPSLIDDDVSLLHTRVGNQSRESLADGNPLPSRWTLRSANSERKRDCADSTHPGSDELPRVVLFRHIHPTVLGCDLHHESHRVPTIAIPTEGTAGRCARARRALLGQAGGSDRGCDHRWGIGALALGILMTRAAANETDFLSQRKFWSCGWRDRGRYRTTPRP
jgi:hypothetical protein